MAEAVTISHGDTLTKILKNQRGLKDSEMPPWLRKLRPLNPHIGDLNRIFPGESVLIPDSYPESVSDDQIWQNAFKAIPRALEFPHNGHTQLFLTTAGTTIDSIAERMFEGGRHQNLPLSIRRAVLIHNNPDLEQYLDTGRLPGNLLVDITPLRLTKFDKVYWRGERQLYMSYFQRMQPMTREMFQQAGPEETYILARLIEVLRQQGAAVGSQALVLGLGYGAGAISGLAASGQMSVAGINALMREMAADAVAKFGTGLASSKKAHHLAQVAKFLKSHPNYTRLMRQVEELPRMLLPTARHKLVPPAAGNVDSAALARWFRKQYFQGFRRRPSGQYMGPIARQLNGRVNLFKGLGRHATWYVPAVIGLYNVFDATPEVRMHTLFEEGFGVVGGALGTLFGSAVVASSVLGMFTIVGFCLGPAGIFVTVFLCATAGGIVGSEIGKKIGGAVYDIGSQLDFGQIYHSPEQLIEGFK